MHRTLLTFPNRDAKRRRFVSVPFSTQLSLEIRHAEGKGRGVFTTKILAANQDILCDPVERYAKKDARYLARHTIYGHLFVDPEHYGITESVDLLWVIGLISILNHSDTPNCRVEWLRDPLGEWALLRSITNIPPNDELLIRYTNIEEYPDHLSFL